MINDPFKINIKSLSLRINIYTKEIKYMKYIKSIYELSG